MDLQSRQQFVDHYRQKLYGDINAEESFTQLPDGSFLTVGCLTGPSQKYIPVLDRWVDAGNTPVSLTSNMGNAAYVPEIGPGLLLYDGRTLYFGASLSTGHTAFYTPPVNPTDPGTWAAGPDIPEALQCDDVVGAVMPNCHVLFAADGSSRYRDSQRKLLTLRCGQRHCFGPRFLYRGGEPVANDHQPLNVDRYGGQRVPLHHYGHQ